MAASVSQQAQRSAETLMVLAVVHGKAITGSAALLISAARPSIKSNRGMKRRMVFYTARPGET
jgi:hypothetical protein